MVDIEAQAESAEGQEKEDGKLGPDAGTVEHWLTELRLADLDQQPYLNRCEKVLRRVFLEDKSKGSKGESKQAGIYLSSMQTIAPSVYGQIPKTDIRRRFHDRAPVGRLSAEILERATDYSLEAHQDFDRIAKDWLSDFLFCSRAVAWEDYEPHIETKKERFPLTAAKGKLYEEDGSAFAGDPKAVKNDGESFYSEEEYSDIAYEESITRRVLPADFRHSPARTVEELRWVARRVFWSLADLRRYQKKGLIDKSIDITKIKRIHKPVGLEQDEEKQAAQQRYLQAEIWQICDLVERKVLMVSKGYGEKPLLVRPDTLKLKKFFPCSILWGTKRPDKLTPIPEYSLLQDQLDTIDKLTERIDILVDSVRSVGFYDELLGTDLNSAFSTDNTLIPVKNWTRFQQSGGWQGVVAWMPIEEIAKVLNQLYAARDRELQLYYELSGQSDLLRGASDPTETAKAQTIKSQFASVRIDSKKDTFAQFLKEVIATKAEIIAEHFQPETLRQMVGLDNFAEPVTEPLFMQAVELLRSDVRRCYALDIETDSTIVHDEKIDQETVNELMGVLTPFLKQMAEICSTTPMLAPVAKELLMFVVRRYPAAARQIEGTIERAIDEVIAAQKAAANQPPPPDPKIIEMQAKVQIEQQRFQMEMQREQWKAQQEMAIERQRLANEMELAKIRLQNELIIEQQKAQVKMEVENAQAQADMATRAVDADFDRRLKEMQMRSEAARPSGKMNGGRKVQ